MHAAEMMLILLFLLLAYGGPFLLGYLYFRLRRARRVALPVGVGQIRSATLSLLCVVTLLLAYGDFKLLAALGAWLGWAPLLPIIVLASTGASLVGLVQMHLQHTERQQTLAFGPYLAVAGAVALFWEMGRWMSDLMLVCTHHTFA